jgi:hypothetical protein
MSGEIVLEKKEFIGPLSVDSALAIMAAMFEKEKQKQKEVE